MILSSDIVKAVTLLLRKKYTTEYKDVDITEGFTRPCMNVRADGIEATTMGDDLLHDVQPVTVYYFAQNTKVGYADLLKKEAELRAIFAAPIALEGGSYIYTDDLSFSLNFEDKSLILELEFDVVQDRGVLSDVVGEDSDISTSLYPSDAVSSDEYMEELIARIESEQGVIIK